ncbi:MAG: FG-GAP repeat protein [Deltaproteobacteria bacterium]|nr:FG-GAP repeat protein [Deltaproteobacteria bacterium]
MPPSIGRARPELHRAACVLVASALIAYLTACDDAALRTVDAGPDARVSDGALDGDAPPGDAGAEDAGIGSDAAMDAARDADEPTDARGVDAEPDAGGLSAPVPTYPWNGLYTGSARAPASGATAHPLRPALRWEPVVGAARYEVSIGDGCVGALPSCEVEGETLEATETRIVPDALEVDLAPGGPVGRRYYWRVRACDSGGACGPWSETRYLEVGRQRTDFDADGYADAAIVASVTYSASDVGAVLVYRGSGDGLMEPPAPRIDPPFDQPGAAFGVACVAVGDIDGDGYPDLAIGSDGHGAGRGIVHVYRGSAAGLQETPSQTLEAPAMLEVEGFGHALAGGDLDGDGYADLAIGAPYAEGGAVFVHRGGERGLSDAPVVTIRGRLTEWFGSTLASPGDTDGDGLVDLLVGDVWHSSAARHAGRAFLYGGARGDVVSAATTAVFEAPDLEVDAEMASALGAVGDLDGDGFAEVVISSHFHDAEAAGEGVVYVYRGARDGISMSPVLTIDSPTDSTGVEHGSRIAGGDLDGDGMADLVLGTPIAPSAAGTVRAGRVDVHVGRSGGIERAASRTLFGGAVDAHFGASVAVVGDVDADGIPDLLVGALLSSGGDGADGSAFVYLSSRGGLTGAPQRIDCPDSALSWFGVGAAASPF